MNLHELYQHLRDQHGPQHWWPADTPFEVMVGAILTQNTAWTNVEKAIANLKSAKALDASVICQLPHAELAVLLRPSGYFNIKARRLHSFCDWYLHAGGHAVLKFWSSGRLRLALLAVNGIGPETADDILLYAFARPVFVIDAYTRRILQRLGLAEGEEGYEGLRARFEAELPLNTRLFKEYHALIVQHGKGVCRASPRCSDCRLNMHCRFGAMPLQ